MPSYSSRLLLIAAVGLTPLPSQLPPAIKQKLVIVKVPASKGAASKGTASTGTATTSTADTPGTSTTGTGGGGKKKVNTTQSADTGATH